MRLIRYLGEDKQEDLIDEMIITLKRDCKPFIKEAKASLEHGKFLFRGTDAYLRVGTMMDKRVSKIEGRTPMSTGVKVHNILNDLFEKRFGWKVRNGVFTADYERAGGYGHQYAFFPIGNYKYCWSPKISDLFSTINYLKYYYEAMEREEKGGGFKKIATEHLEEFYLNIKRDLHIDFTRPGVEPSPYNIPKALAAIIAVYQETELNKAILVGNEIVFNCKEYYLVDSEYFIRGMMSQEYYYKKLVWYS